MSHNGKYISLADARARADSVLIAMSGGVDSAVAGLLVKQAGFRAVALTMKNYCYGDVDVPDRSCCSVEAIGDARRECERLGIPHRVADVEEFFTREVVDNFLSEYESGRTPNPCVRCNSIVRFETLLDYADRLGIHYVATGHYARVYESASGQHYLARASNRHKDQTYFLSGVHGDTLGRILFPLGDYEDKSQVRDLASGAAMAVADKKESQEVCFVPDGTLRSFLEANDVKLDGGVIENARGEVVGEHSGLASYTIGQRRHLGVSALHPQYVVDIDRDRNVLVIGDESELMRSSLVCRLEWYDPAIVDDCSGVVAQIRYRHGGVAVADVQVGGQRARVTFVTAQKAICPGQTVALYRDDMVVASGVIDGGAL